MRTCVCDCVHARVCVCVHAIMRVHALNDERLNVRALLSVLVVYNNCNSSVPEHIYFFKCTVYMTNFMMHLAWDFFC